MAALAHTTQSSLQHAQEAFSCARLQHWYSFDVEKRNRAINFVVVIIMLRPDHAHLLCLQLLSGETTDNHSDLGFIIRRSSINLFQKFWYSLLQLLSIKRHILASAMLFRASLSEPQIHKKPEAAHILFVRDLA